MATEVGHGRDFEDGLPPTHLRPPMEKRIIIERWMLDDLGLKGTSAIIYAAIWQAGPEGLRASLPAIGFTAGVSPKSAKRSLTRLVEAGLIEAPDRAEGACSPRTWRVTAKGPSARKTL